MSRLRLGLAIIGFVLALVSVVLNDSRIGWAAIGALAASAIIRLIQRKQARKNSDDVS